MPGDVGLVAELLTTVAKWAMSEDGYRQWAKERTLAKKRKEAHDALASNDYAALRRLIRELRDLEDKA